jgi:high-affinity iron transporter
MAFLILITLPVPAARRIQTVLLAMIGAGMALQATQLLTQADWLEPGLPLWESSELLSENSMLGQMAYAVVGYEATPSAPEISAAAIALAAILALRWLWRAKS